MTARYEYKIATQKAKALSGKLDPTVVEALLNAHAADGWRLVAMTTSVSTTDNTSLMMTFERELR